MNVLLEVPSCVDALVTRTPEATRQTSSAPLLQIIWRPKALLAKAQRKYAEFFGTKKLACRKMEPLALSDRAKQVRTRAIKTSKPSGLQPGVASSNKPGAPRTVAKIEMRRRWTSHVKQLVKNEKAGGGFQTSTASPGCTARQKMALAALAARKSRDRSEFDKAEKLTGLVRPVKPLRTLAKAKAKGVKRRALQSVWFENMQVAKAAKMDVAATQNKTAAEVLVVDDYEKTLKAGALGLHCRLHGKILAAKTAKIDGGKLTGPHTRFSKPTQKRLIYASSAAKQKHSLIVKELQNAPCIKFVPSEDIFFHACKDPAHRDSQRSCLVVRAEIAALLQRLHAADLPGVAVLTATHFVEDIGVIS